MFACLFLNFIYLVLAVLRLHSYSGFPLVVASRGYSLVVEHRSLIVASFVTAPGARAPAQYLWGRGLVARRHVGSSQIRDPTVSPALVGGFLTTEPLGKPQISVL